MVDGPTIFEPDAPPPAIPDRFVRVVVERGIDAAPGRDGLTYALPEGVTAAPGQRVRVPLGRGDRPTPGIVVAAGGVELLDGFDPRRTKPVLDVTGAELPADLIDLARWMADYYATPLGMVLATMLPAAVKTGTGARTETRLMRTTTDPAAAADLPPSARTAWTTIAALPDDTFPITSRDLAATAHAKTRGPINRLTAAGLLAPVEVETVRAPEAFWTDRPAPPAPPPLIDAQRRAVESILAARHAFAVHLLHGVTGSGKTEVYLRILEHVLDAGQTALVLVPEIALTPQTAGRFIDRFASAGVAVLHSGLSASQRHKQWRHAADGRARVVVGARSAVFAPLPNLGVVVIDEEHDASYKQDQLPRYHARDVAIKRAHTLGIPVVLGSATPALESYLNAIALPERPARYTYHALPRRVTGRPLPPVELIDLAHEREPDPNDSRRFRALGATLATALAQTLEDGAQAVLLLNRRGLAAYVACPDRTCGWVMECERCDAAMVVHRAATRHGQLLACHHCQAEQLRPATCPVCAKRTIDLGVGTQRVETELEERFADSHGLRLGETLLRLDADTMRTARDYFDALTRFAEGEVRVLLGTQMIAKGLDVPGVRLAGVINADTALHLPDFRAAERTFQLVTQLAGRAGRGDHPGRVIVQTMAPDEPALQAAAQHDYAGFANAELCIRRDAKLPPFTRMARVVCRDEDFARADAAASEVAACLRAIRVPGLRVEGPPRAPSPASAITTASRSRSMRTPPPT